MPVFDRVFSLKISSNGFHLAAGVYSGNILIYNINNGRLVTSLIGHTYGVSELVLISSNLLASSSGGDVTTRIWDLANNYTSKLAINVGSDHYEKISCSALATYPGDYRIKLWDIESGQLVKVLSGHSSNIYGHSYDILSYGQTIVSGSWDQTIRIWDLITGQCLSKLNTPKYVMALAIVIEIYTVILTFSTFER
jgi:WD40 repeat protein